MESKNDAVEQETARRIKDAVLLWVVAETAIARFGPHRARSQQRDSADAVLKEVLGTNWDLARALYDGPFLLRAEDPVEEISQACLSVLFPPSPVFDGLILPDNLEPLIDQ